ncbi:MAG: hypothetical protein HFK08_01760 [Clostridia bacterium]|nr:hypothetical protein [Clostridia bacterium]
MSASEVIISEQALTAIASSIKTYVATIRESIMTTLRSLKANGSEWSDEDFNSLVSAINSFLTGIESMDNATNQLVERINNKIGAIHVLHNMKI